MKVGVLGIFSAIFASICCVLPLLLIFLGLGSLGVGAAISRYHWLFLGIGVLLVVLAWGYYFKEKQMRSKRLTQIILIAASVVVVIFVLLSLYPYISKSCCVVQ